MDTLNFGHGKLGKVIDKNPQRVQTQLYICSYIILVPRGRYPFGQ